MDNHLLTSVVSTAISAIGAGFIAVNFMLARIDKLDEKLSNRIDKVEFKIDEVDKRLSAKIEKLEDKFDKLKDSVSNMSINIARIEVYVHGLPISEFKANRLSANPKSIENPD